MSGSFPSTAYRSAPIKRVNPMHYVATYLNTKNPSFSRSFKACCITIASSQSQAPVLTIDIAASRTLAGLLIVSLTIGLLKEGTKVSIAASRDFFVIINTHGSLVVILRRIVFISVKILIILLREKVIANRPKHIEKAIE